MSSTMADREFILRTLAQHGFKTFGEMRESLRAGWECQHTTCFDRDHPAADVWLEMINALSRLGGIWQTEI